jgi:DNA-binding LacI/PurR family transcriptional regulator
MIARRTLLKELGHQLTQPTATVSRALAGVPSVSSATQQRGRELANSLNFQLNLSVSVGRRGCTGVIVPALTGYFSLELLHNITKFRY